MRARFVVMALFLVQTFFLFSSPGEKNQPLPVFNRQNAYNFLVKQCAFGPRNPGSLGSHKCRDYFVKTLQSFSAKVEVQHFTITFGSPPTKVKGANIIARFQPDKTERILLCAHWDTRPWADKDSNPQNRTKPILGANDGASGVAVLLEIANILYSHKSKVGVDIVLFDGEDAGAEGNTKSWAQGSAFFAKNIPQDFRPRWGILLDMIGDTDLVLYKEVNSWTYARPVVEKVWSRASKLGLNAFKPETGYAVMDDHIPLLAVGIPCIDLIDFDYPYWHTMEDTPDKCSASSLGQIGRLLVDLIYKND